LDHRQLFTAVVFFVFTAVVFFVFEAGQPAKARSQARGLRAQRRKREGPDL
jgi:cbb3-type cytochrome oxidase subunit 3